jgi:bifunctional DNase/RNase
MAQRAGLATRGHAALVLLALVCACGDSAPQAPPDVRVRVDRVVIDENHAPVVVLEEEGGTRWLPIWIGSEEAHSIALEMEALHLPRPNSHDLARDLIRGLDAEVARVVVTELRDGTYYATLHLQNGERSVGIDARPSDAIAIALRAHAPIFVRETLFGADADTEHIAPGAASRHEI